MEENNNVNSPTHDNSFKNVSAKSNTTYSSFETTNKKMNCKLY